MRKKLIEVALPLEAINKASAREKSIRHGHPSTLHLWWARRPLAAACAVIFAQMVDDPSSYPELFPTETAQEEERQRLFQIIEALVQWENTTNEVVLEQARKEIWKSWRATCAENKNDPRAAELFDPNKLPAFHDPFAGGGTLPLEAQRLGLESFASDLNPIAVLINKAMIEIPPKFVGRPPINPAIRKDKILFQKTWHGADGLAEDVRYYGQLIRDEAEKKIGHLYPMIEITGEMAKERSDLKTLVRKKLTVIAWIWARTVRSPNPAFAHVHVPLASTFILSTREGQWSYIKPEIKGDSYRFTVIAGKPEDIDIVKNGTKLVRANFACLLSGTPIPGDYIKAEGQAGRIGARLMAIVAEGERGRVYLAPTTEHEEIALRAKPDWKPEVEFFQQALGFRVGNYGMTKWGDLFTDRQLVALTTFSDLVQVAQEQVRRDAIAAGWSEENLGIDAGGVDATAYAEAVSTYAAFAVDKGANYWSSLCSWHSGRDTITSTFSRQVVPIVWDFAEANPFSASSGSWMLGIEQASRMLLGLGIGPAGIATQSDAQTQNIAGLKVISTDPPYYDNIGYADLSDFFYVWMRRSQIATFPKLFATVAVPKVEELVATPARHGGRENAETFFLEGMTQAMHRLAEQSHPAYPVTIYYAFKQSEMDKNGIASTGWETFLDAVIRAGFAITGTWPVRTEYTSNLKTTRSALASSIVLVCRPRESNASTATLREFLAALTSELPIAVKHLQRGNIAPVDLAQAAIGPGMAVYTRFAKVLDASGKQLPVREALTFINQSLDESLAEQEGDFDADSRWALSWFERSGFEPGEYGVAETLSKAKNTSVGGMVEAGILASKGSKVRLLRPDELPADWDPASDPRLTAWEVVHQLIRVLQSDGERTAAQLVAKLGSKAEIARELAYRLYTLCERNKRAQEALSYNGIVQSWPEILRLSREGDTPQKTQAGLFRESEE